MPEIGGKRYNTMNDINITLNGVTKLLKDLNPNKESGPDELTPRILKELHEEMAPAVTYLFQKSPNLGQTPGPIDWKHAYVFPIFKKGARHEPANYKPVSLTCILCKLMEHIIVSEGNVMKHLENNKVLTKFQHGYIEARDRAKHN